METFKIKAVLAAVKHKSLSRAAEDFSYTPSAFSHLASGFEQELGVQLFKRSSTGVELTEEGKMLYPKFKSMLECENDLWNTVVQLKDNKDFELRIGTFPSISRNLLSGVLKKVKKEYPHIKLSVNVVDSLAGWFEEERADIIFADHITFGKNEWFPMMEDRYYVVASPELQIGREFITREELYNYPHIFTDDIYLKQYFDMSKFRELIYFKSEDDLSVINMVKEGLGLTVLSELVLKEAISGVSVIRLEPKITRILGFAYNKQRIQSLGLTKFIKSLKM